MGLNKPPIAAALQNYMQSARRGNAAAKGITRSYRQCQAFAIIIEQLPSIKYSQPDYQGALRLLVPTLAFSPHSQLAAAPLNPTRLA